jgi:hypothetical protein
MHAVAADKRGGDPPSPAAAGAPKAHEQESGAKRSGARDDIAVNFRKVLQ